MSNKALHMEIEDIEKAMGKSINELMENPQNRESLVEILSEKSLKKLMNMPNASLSESELRIVKEQFVEYGHQPTIEELTEKGDAHIAQLEKTEQKIKDGQVAHYIREPLQKIVGKSEKLENIDDLLSYTNQIFTAETSQYREKIATFVPALRLIGNAILEDNPHSYPAFGKLESLQKIISDPTQEKIARKYNAMLLDTYSEVEALDELRKLQRDGVIGEKFEIKDAEKFRKSPLVTEGLGILSTPKDLSNTPTMQKCRRATSAIMESTYEK